VTAYYNEVDPYAAQWLRNLIEAGHIAPGIVDERSIEDVRPDDIRGFTQCHFFAGIGVWSLALRRAGWRDDQSVWTGSCPCQPFSAAGKGNGFADERHLWPSWFHLITQCQPNRIFGEQVASKDADTWIDLVQTDLEAMGYAVGAVPFPSASVGAPHIRDRLYWMADATMYGHDRATLGRSAGAGENDRGLLELEGRGTLGGMAFSESCGRTGEPLRQSADRSPGRNARDGELGGMGNNTGSQGRLGMPERSFEQPIGAASVANAAAPTNGFWGSADWLYCRDGKWRPVEPGTFPLAHGATSRVGRLRAYGNAINAQQAQIFIESYIEGVRQ